MKIKVKAVLGTIAIISVTAVTAGIWLTGKPSGNKDADFVAKTLCKSELLSGDNDYEKYRIPGIVITKKDTVLIYFEARKSSGDWSAMDIVLFRSTDKGESFSQGECIVAGASDGVTVNNPVIIEGNDSTLYLLYCREYGVTERNGGVFIKTSNDDGVTWSSERDITAFTLPEYRNAFATGPGHGICLDNGTLLVPIWMVPKSAGAELTSHHPAEVRVFYSTDNGESWQISDKISDGDITDPNETAAALCSDGSVILNIRVPDTGLRGVSRSKNGISDYSPITLDSALIDPTCFGSLTSYTASDSSHTLLFVNCENKLLRTNLTVKASTDDGKSWSYRGVVDSGLAGYADIAVDSTGKIFTVYETDNCKRAVLARFDIDFLKQYSAKS